MTCPATSAISEKTSVLAASSRPRRGIAASVVWIMPVAYSDVTVRMPSTLMTSWPMKKLVSDIPVGSHVRRSSAVRALWFASSPLQTSRVMVTLATSMVSSVHQTERRLRNFVHSERSRSVNRTRAGWAPEGGRSAVSGASWTVCALMPVPLRTRRCPGSAP
nr:hypothetical protein [Actinomadura soli]